MLRSLEQDDCPFGSLQNGNNWGKTIGRNQKQKKVAAVEKLENHRLNCEVSKGVYTTVEGKKHERHKVIVFEY